MNAGSRDGSQGPNEAGRRCGPDRRQNDYFLRGLRKEKQKQKRKREREKEPKRES
jgi:hypothetical protein